ncbi:MAG: DUF4340 domain-containing protein, partial [Gemmataceae bacterium]
LEVLEYVDDAPKADDLKTKYGLAPARATVTLTFNGQPRKLELGNSPEFKPEVYARLDGGSVFTLPKTTFESVSGGALALLPLQLWTTVSDRVVGIEIRRGADAYSLRPDGANWKLSGPFEAPVPFPLAQPLVLAVSTLKAEKYESTQAVPPEKFGFDAPVVRLAVQYKDAKPGDPVVTRTVLIGKPTAPGATTRFAKLDGDPITAVFSVPETLVTSVNRPALELVERNLLSLDPGTIAKLTITPADANSNITLIREATGAGWKAENLPFAVDSLAANGTATVLARLPVRSLAAYGPATKFAEFGLEPPQFTFTMTPSNPADKPHTVQVGKPTPTGGRYVRVDNGPAVGMIERLPAGELTQSRLDFVDRTLLNFDPAQLAGLSRHDDDDKHLDIVPAATVGWDITTPMKTKADAMLMDELAESLARLRALRVVAFNPASLAPFGLEEPAAALTLFIGLEKPTKVQLLLGAPVDAKNPRGDRYAMRADQRTGAVAVLPGGLAERLLAAPLKFQDRTLAKFTDADRIQLTTSSRQATFAKVNGTWKMVAPLASDAETGDLDEFINTLAKLRADELLSANATPAELKALGLETPEATWTIFAGTETKLTLQLGRELEGGRRVGRVAGSTMIAAFDEATSAKLRGEYRKRAVWTGVDASQVEVIAISAGTTSLALRKVGQTWVDTATPTDAIENTKV